MKLHDLRVDFMLLNETEQRESIANYRTLRQRVLEAVLPKKRAKKSTKKQTSFEELGLTPEEEAIAKALGLTPKQVLSMRK